MVIYHIFSNFYHIYKKKKLILFKYCHFESNTTKSLTNYQNNTKQTATKRFFVRSWLS